MDRNARKTRGGDPISSADRNRAELSVGANLDQDVGRELQIDPRELRDSITKTILDGEEAKRYVEERSESIRKGARRAPKRFRL